MKSFSQSDIAKAYVHPEKDKVLKYLELMYGKDSVLIQFPIEERQKLALTKSGWKGDPEIQELKDKAFFELFFHYVSYWQYNNKVTLLLSKQHLLNVMIKKIFEPTELDLKQVELMGKISQLADDLTTRIEGLYGEIYGQHKEHAKEIIKTVISAEERIKNQRQ